MNQTNLKKPEAVEPAPKKLVAVGSPRIVDRGNDDILDPTKEREILTKALLSREVEETLLGLYSEGKLFGTVHTCIGQEFSGAVIGTLLEKGDSLFSNHRCHGHYLSFTGDVVGLIAEIMGKQTGTCGGRGGSQHLCRDGFFSNGLQGGIVPVSAGLALARKMDQQGRISAVFIGDGTLGEGAVYESLNIIAKWDLPLLVILENNGYAQSTRSQETLAGNIDARAESFGIRTAQADTWNWRGLFQTARDLISWVRHERQPAFLTIDTYRLKAHSKGDDTRSREEVAPYEERDPLNRLAAAGDPEFQEIQYRVREQVKAAVLEAHAAPQPFPHAVLPLRAARQQVHFLPVHPVRRRLVQALNETFKHLMERYHKMMFIGEDVCSPYGGAFKVSRDLSDLFPGRVLNTPIAEAALTGLGTGLAMAGYHPFIEIMFGDFLTLAFDQILNHAAKFPYMYNNQVRANTVIRTPMGGRRGYGPTHSQTLDRHFVGIPGLQVVAINNLIEPCPLYEAMITSFDEPTLVIENKSLYAAFLRDKAPPGFRILAGNETFPTVLVQPESERIDLTLMGYGGMSEILIETANRLFEDHDLVAQVIIPTRIYPFSVEPLLGIFRRAPRLVIAEEGQGFAGFGAEVLAQIAELEPGLLEGATRIMPPAQSIPAARDLERAMLPDVSHLLRTIVGGEA